MPPPAVQLLAEDTSPLTDSTLWFSGRDGARFCRICVSNPHDESVTYKVRGRGRRESGAGEGARRHSPFGVANM
jgi:hypothetical protein